VKIRSAIPIALLVSVALAGPVAAQTAPTLFTHEAMIATKRLGAVVPSPDGRQAVIQILTYSYDGPGPTAICGSSTWSARPAPPPRQLTTAPGVESSPTWSPDGRTIVFVARAGDGPSQLFRVDAAGGTPVQLTRLSTGASQPRFSPDGRTIAFLSNVYPDAADDAANAARLKAARDNPSSARIYTGFPYRDYGNNWFDGRVNHLFTVGPDGGDPRALLTGTPLVARAGWSGVMEFDWRPDSRRDRLQRVDRLPQAGRPLRHEGPVPRRGRRAARRARCSWTRRPTTAIPSSRPTAATSRGTRCGAAGGIWE
jgi:dipeptidyl aminopeptidase/acylaminoacyl peptidase